MAKIKVFDLPESKNFILPGYSCVMHLHAIEEQVEICRIKSKWDPLLKKNTVSKFLRPGEEGIVVIKVIFRIKFRVKK
jgi:translation elongation factor EF-1alpha